MAKHCVAQEISEMETDCASLLDEGIYSVKSYVDLIPWRQIPSRSVPY